MKASPKLNQGLKAVFIRELKRISSRSIYLWILFILPLFSFLFFISMFQAGKASENKVAVLDADQSVLSRMIIRSLDATPEIELTQYVHSLAEARDLIERAEVVAVLDIPKGLENAIYKGDQNPIAFYYANDNLTVGTSVSSAAIKTIKTISAGINLKKRISKNEMMEQAYHQVQPIKIETHTLYNPYVNYAYYLVTALLPVMLLMFIMSATIFAIGGELKHRTAKEWYEISGESMVVALTGKLLPYSIIFIIEAFFMNTLLFTYMGAPMNGNLFILFILILFFVFAYQAVGVIIISIFPNMRLSLSFGAAYSSLAFSFSGLTFPSIAMDPFFRSLANLFPYTHYLDIYINEAMKGLSLKYSLCSFLALSVFIVVPFFLLPRLRSFLTKEKFWGKS